MSINEKSGKRNIEQVKNLAETIKNTSEFEFLIGKNNVEQIKNLFKTIKNTSEFEFIMFSKKDKSLTLEKYISLLKFLSKRESKDKKLRLVSNEVTLDVSYNPEKGTSYRATLINKSAINEHMERLGSANNHVIFKELIKSSITDKNIQAIKKGKSDENTIDVDDLYMRVRLSDELELTKEEIKSLSKLSHTEMDKIILRFKERTSLYIVDTDNEYVKIDLTITRMNSKYDRLNDAIPRYELEIETKSDKPNEKLLDVMFNETEKLFKVLQQSNFIITRSLSEKVIQDYKILLSVPQANEKSLYGRRPVSLEIQYVEFISNKYAVTDKADGERHFLIINDNHVYLMNTNLDVRDTGIVLKKNQQKYNNSVVDGELILVKGRHIFLVFDCLFEGGVDIRKQVKLETRLVHADNIINDCFVFEKQKGYKFESSLQTKNFNLDKELDFHRGQIKKMFDNLNHDMGLEKEYVLIRRKYFIHSLGAKSWEIYTYSSLIWRLYTNDSDIKCPYVLDGLIYQPNEQAYIVNKKESKYDDYKWKPPEKNSIDFYIEYVKDANGNVLSVYDNSYDEITDDQNATENVDQRIRNKNYKICRLFVGDMVGHQQKPILFREHDELYEAYILLKDGEARDVDGNILTDKTVVEFYYNADANISHKFKWIPLKTRYDKTESVIRYKQNYGNFFTVADRVWKSIINPVLMSDFDDLSKGNNPDKNQYFYDKKLESIRKKIGHDLIVSAAKESQYFQKITDLAFPMRSFHNFIKTNIIHTFCHSMYQDYKQKSVLDLGCGRGGDLDKFYYAKAAFYVGVDFDRDALTNPIDSAMSRYEQKKRKPGFTKMFFIHGDFAAELDYENQYKSIGGMDAQNKQLIEKFFSKDPKKRSTFDVINIQFAIHYAFKNEDTLKNLKANINNYLRNDGYLLVTTFDSNAIRKLLKGKDKYTQEYTDKNGNVKTLFEIKKKYEDVDDDVVMGTGNAIDVHMAWLFNDGVFQPEYLVDDRFIIDEFKKDCNLELVSTDSFENQLTLHKEYLTEYAEFEADERTKKNLEKFAQIYKRSSENDGSRVYTNLERYYVFRKNNKDAVKSSNQKNQKGSGFMNIEKYVVTPIIGQNNKYSFLNSIHDVLINNAILPPDSFTEQFCDNMDIDYVDDLEIDKQYKNVAKKIVIFHEERGKRKKAINGVNILIAERDCNDEYDIDLIKKSKNINEDDPVIILVKEGGYYAPVYAIGKGGVKDGLFHIGDPLIKELQQA
jgi:SAM-dependent methyltransferase/nicotinic acid mononucleotide adenylyltransferase